MPDPGENGAADEPPDPSDGQRQMEDERALELIEVRRDSPTGGFGDVLRETLDRD